MSGNRFPYKATEYRAANKCRRLRNGPDLDRDAFSKVARFP